MILHVAAIREEAAGLPAHCEVLELGVGKVTAATRLATRLVAGPPVDLVVNLGTAGGLHGQPMGTVVEVRRVVQHDLDVAGISSLVGRPMPGGPLTLDHGDATLATGDRFVTDPAERSRIAATADVVDMEGYAVVATCLALGVDVRVLKCVSDGADDDSATTWKQAVDRCATRLAEAATAAGLVQPPA
ncbi:nucleosidase [Salsipaludibacter albus]|uniref:nucleosidase n=1 Tax=Salsipaludibacter albus TaxID=2849650 RepID=UPI001EE3C976|nr:hypothetical protein [Salsipaludibacter albus]